MKTLLSAVSLVAMFAIVSCASNVPPPDDENAEAWTPGIKSSYPDWQPPEEMPDGNPAYAEAFGEPRPVVSKEETVVVVAVNETAEEAAPVKKVEEDGPKVQEQKPQPVETKPAAPAKFMRVDVFPAETGVDGVYAVNGDRVNAADLKSALTEAGKANKDIAVILYARSGSAAADLDAAIAFCKAAGIEKLNVMTNDDIMAQRRAEVRAAKGIKDEPADTKGASSKPVREKLAADDSQPSTDYVVQDGDSLSAIAKTLYHDGTAWEIIFDANKELLNGKPNFLKPGMKLVIPAVKKVPVSTK